MNPSLKRIDVVVLFVADLERAWRFYRDVLGLPVTFEDSSSVYCELNGASLLLLNTEGALDLLPAGAVHTGSRAGAPAQLVSFVEDVDAFHTYLVAQGVQIVREPVDRDWGLRTLHFRDPDGNIWEVSHPLSKPEGGE